MYLYKWRNLDTGECLAFINNSEGSIVTLTKEEYFSLNVPDKTMEANDY